MKRLPAALSLITALVAVVAASAQPEAQTQIHVSAVATPQQLSEVIDFVASTARASLF